MLIDSDLARKCKFDTNYKGCAYREETDFSFRLNLEFNAKLMYEFALDKYYAINDETGAIIVNAKLKDIGGAIQADALAQANTEKLEKAAENAFKTKNYEKAKGYYKELFEQYTKAGDTVNVQRVQSILDEIDTQVALKDIDNNKK